LRLRWADEALSDLEAVADQAPRAAEHLLDGVEWLVESPSPAMY